MGVTDAYNQSLAVQNQMTIPVLQALLRQQAESQITPYQQALLQLRQKELSKSSEMTPYQAAQVDIEKQKMKSNEDLRKEYNQLREDLAKQAREQRQEEVKTMKETKEEQRNLAREMKKEQIESSEKIKQLQAYNRNLQLADKDAGESGRALLTELRKFDPKDIGSKSEAEWNALSIAAKSYMDSNKKIIESGRGLFGLGDKTAQTQLDSTAGELMKQVQNLYLQKAYFDQQKDIGRLNKEANQAPWGANLGSWINAALYKTTGFNAPGFLLGDEAVRKASVKYPGLNYDPTFTDIMKFRDQYSSPFTAPQPNVQGAGGISPSAPTLGMSSQPQDTFNLLQKLVSGQGIPEQQYNQISEEDKLRAFMNTDFQVKPVNQVNTLFPVNQVNKDNNPFAQFMRK